MVYYYLDGFGKNCGLSMEYGNHMKILMFWDLVIILIVIGILVLKYTAVLQAGENYTGVILSVGFIKKK